MRKINPDNVEWWFDPWKLKAHFMFNGYENYCAPIARLLNLSEKTVKNKVSYSRLSHEETLLLAKGLGLTMEQYCEVFCKGMFTNENTPD